MPDDVVAYVRVDVYKCVSNCESRQLLEIWKCHLIAVNVTLPVDFYGLENTCEVTLAV